MLMTENVLDGPGSIHNCKRIKEFKFWANEKFPLSAGSHCLLILYHVLWLWKCIRYCLCSVRYTAMKTKASHNLILKIMCQMGDQVNIYMLEEVRGGSVSWSQVDREGSL